LGITLLQFFNSILLNSKSDSPSLGTLAVFPAAGYNFLLYSFAPANIYEETETRNRVKLN
jgi:hypothetical protein